MLDGAPLLIEAQALERKREASGLNLQQARVTCGQRDDIELLLRERHLASAHRVRLVEAEHRNIHVLDPREELHKYKI